MVKNNIQKTQFESEMKNFISLIKKHEQISDKEIEDSWDNIRQNLPLSFPPKKRRVKAIFRYLLAGCSVAASIAIICSISINKDTGCKESQFFTELVTPVAVGNQVSLVLSDNRQIELENNSNINYDEFGCVTVINESPQVPESAETEEQKFNQVIVPKGKRTHLILSDGTKIYVNSASRVIYPTVFAADKRMIAVEGEAYLEVAHNAEKPFIVKTKGIDVRVLGTSFNVNAYEQDNISVVLVEGRVEINPDKKTKMLLEPSQMACLENGVLRKKKQVNTLKYTCWKDNIMLLEKEKVAEVLDKVARYYDVSIQYDKDAASRRLSGKLNLCDSIESVLDIIKVSASLQMEKTGDNKYRFY